MTGPTIVINRFALLCLLLLATACGPAQIDAPADRAENHEPLALTAGTSFGMCAGSCTTELRLDSATVHLIESGGGRGEPKPPRARSLTLTAAEWSRLVARLDRAALTALAGVHGCPDCADGGAEWIELRGSTGPVRVTFEHGRPPAGVAPLRAEVEAIRSRLMTAP